MILLNFSHPITAQQQAQTEELLGAPISCILAVMPQFDEQQPFLPQLRQLLDQIELAPEQWQSDPI